MVILQLTAIDQKGEMRDFLCQLPELEAGFDLLTTITTLGHTLVKANVLEERIWTKLPLDAFDENPVSPVIKQLKAEWQQLLTTLPDQ